MPIMDVSLWCEPPLKILLSSSSSCASSVTTSRMISVRSPGVVHSTPVAGIPTQTYIRRHSSAADRPADRCTGPPGLTCPGLAVDAHAPILIWRTCMLSSLAVYTTYFFIFLFVVLTIQNGGKLYLTLVHGRNLRFPFYIIN